MHEAPDGRRVDATDQVESAVRIRNATADPLFVAFGSWACEFSLLPGGEFTVTHQAPAAAFFAIDRVEPDPRLADVFVNGGLGSPGMLTVSDHSSLLPPLPIGGSYAGMVRWPAPPRTATDVGIRVSDDRSPRPRLLWAGRLVASGTRSWVTATPPPGAVVTVELHADHVELADAVEVRVVTPDQDAWWAAIPGPTEHR